MASRRFRRVLAASALGPQADHMPPLYICWMQAPLACQLDDSFKGSRIKYEPVGVVLGITPWNFPLSERGGGGELSGGMTPVNDQDPHSA